MLVLTNNTINCSIEPFHLPFVKPDPRAKDVVFSYDHCVFFEDVLDFIDSLPQKKRCVLDRSIERFTAAAADVRCAGFKRIDEFFLFFLSLYLSLILCSCFYNSILLIAPAKFSADIE